MSENDREKDYSSVVNRLEELHRTSDFPWEGFPEKDQVILLITELQGLLFPSYYKKKSTELLQSLLRAEDLLRFLLSSVYKKEEKNVSKISARFIEDIPKIFQALQMDLEAFYDGDPAARNKEEIVLCYPGFYAITLYRIAHRLSEAGVPYLPRMITEIAHEKTGIDIHPCAKIGKFFFIDHGTGIVVGETTEIGDFVKLYQGVTLGAKSFQTDENGNPVKGGKRHPTIGNRVVIYANATILGGSTVVEDDCVIGGNVWLTSSVEKGTTVYYTNEKNDD